jgi:uncharacterized membrane protein YkoI
MGYRSEVAYAVSFPDAEHKGAFVAAIKLGGDQHQIEALSELNELDDKVLVGHFCDVKWYESFEEVKSHHELMDMAVEEFKGSYVFARIGEEYDDVEFKNDGSNPPFDRIDIHRSIEIS